MPAFFLRDVAAFQLFLPSPPRLAALAQWLAVTVLLILSVTARADGIQVKSAGLELVEGVYQLNADFDITFTSKLEDALAKGVPLTFEVEFEVIHPRWYWLDEEVARVQQHVRLSYNALTRQYQLSTGGIHQNFSSFSEAKAELSRIRDWQVLDRSLLKKRVTYEAGLRMRLDVSQLPKPLQINALASNDWNLDSDWHRWPLTP